MDAIKVPGTQVVSRVAALLRIVGESSPTGAMSNGQSRSTSAPNGATAAEVAQVASLTRPTAHRLLTALANEGLLDFDPATSRWSLGPEIYLLGSLAAPRFDITDIARPSVQALAELTGESAFLSVRRGNETVCLLREEGSFPVRSHVLTEGIRFPLGVASAGLAILAFLPDEEIEAHLRSMGDHKGIAEDRSGNSLVPRFSESHSREHVWTRIRQTRENGYALNPGLLVEGSWGMGAAIFDASARPAWALSLTGIDSRFKPERQAELGRLLVEHAHVVTRKLRAESSQ
ncbi:MAG: IclR family transcriptional regulator [Actinomycetales bacterium]|nr:IclR family transcriptional regulator [Actinomycetales bacterium]